jgi:hypothetical protein
MDSVVQAVSPTKETRNIKPIRMVCPYFLANARTTDCCCRRGVSADMKQHMLKKM